MSKVTYKNDNSTVEVENGEKLMNVTNDNDWPVAYGCEDGLCGTCIVKVDSGYENLNSPSDVEEMTLTAMGVFDGKHRLACQCKVNGDVTIETH